MLRQKYVNKRKYAAVAAPKNHIHTFSSDCYLNFTKKKIKEDWKVGILENLMIKSKFRETVLKGKVYDFQLFVKQWGIERFVSTICDK